MSWYPTGRRGRNPADLGCDDSEFRHGWWTWTAKEQNYARAIHGGFRRALIDRRLGFHPQKQGEFVQNVMLKRHWREEHLAGFMADLSPVSPGSGSGGTPRARRPKH